MQLACSIPTIRYRTNLGKQLPGRIQHRGPVANVFKMLTFITEYLKYKA